MEQKKASKNGQVTCQHILKERLNTEMLNQGMEPKFEASINKLLPGDQLVPNLVVAPINFPLRYPINLC